MDKWQAQDAFWNSFGIPAYDEQTTFTKGEEPSFPHITYQSFGGNIGQTATLSASIWYRSESWAEAKRKASEIQKSIMLSSPLALPIDDGFLWMKVPASVPFAQPMSGDSDDYMIKRILLTVEAECLTAF